VYKEGKYDVTVGASERAESVNDFKFPVGVPTSKSNFTHLLTVFGGVQGLELLLSNYWDLEKIEDPSLLFDCHLNTQPGQQDHQDGGSAAGHLGTAETQAGSEEWLKNVVFGEKCIFKF